MEHQKENISEWYNYPGTDDDIVVSTRIRLARNLADFPFTENFKGDDSARIRNLVTDSFLNSDSASSYRVVSVSDLEELNLNLFIERGIFSGFPKNENSAVIMKISGKDADSGLVCTVNFKDHVRISSFVTGLNPDKSFFNCSSVDMLLQKKLQFAASFDFGYLTTNLKDSGSAMKISVRIFLPAIVLSGKLGEVKKELSKQNFLLNPAFKNLRELECGCFFNISTLKSQSGSETEQIASFLSAVKSLVEKERHEEKNIFVTNKTQIEDDVVKSFCLGNSSILLDFKDALKIVAGIKLGLNTGILHGISHCELDSLLFRIQDSYIKALMRTENLKFPSDIENNGVLKVKRLRASVIQEIMQAVKIKQE